AQRSRRVGFSNWRHTAVSEKRSSLCNLCVLCVSVVNRFAAKHHHRDTENTEAAQRNQRGSTFRAKPVAFLLMSSLMTSCSRAPSFDILGSYFPAWLICLALGV